MARPQIHFRTTEEQKQRWQEYVSDSPKYDTLTDLIRTAVEREISDVSRTDIGGNVDSEQLGILDERTDRILTRLDSMESTLEDAADAMYQGEKADGELTMEIWRILPSEKERAKPLTELTELLDAPSEQVKDALKDLLATHSVEKGEREDGVVGYYSKE